MQYKCIIFMQFIYILYFYVQFIIFIAYKIYFVSHMINTFFTKRERIVLFVTQFIKNITQIIFYLLINLNIVFKCFYYVQLSKVKKENLHKAKQNNNNDDKQIVF